MTHFSMILFKWISINRRSSLIKMDVLIWRVCGRENIYSDSKYNSRNCEEEANKCMDEMDLDKEWIQ